MIEKLKASLTKVITQNTSPGGLIFDLTILVAIISSIVTLGLSVDPGMDHWMTQINRLEWCFVFLFSFEYVLRLWVSNPTQKYARSFLGIVDLIAILPAYLSLIPGVEIQYLLLLRVFRVLKLKHLLVYSAEIGKTRSLVVVLLTLLATFAGWHLARTPGKTLVVFTTGSEGGKYYQMGESLKRIIESECDNLRIELKESDGSNSNIDALENNVAQLGWIQNDCPNGKNVRSIASVYPEFLHLITNKNLKINNLSDLPGKRINIGPPSSGTKQVTEQLLLFSKVSIQSDHLSFLPTRKAIEALKKDEIDGVFFLTGLGSKALVDCLSDSNLCLTPIKIIEIEADPIDIAQDLVDGIRITYPYLEPGVIPRMAYEGKPKTPLPSINVNAVLACAANLEPEIVYQITNTLFKMRAELSSQDVLFSYLDETRATSNLQYPLHDGAENYFERKEPGFLVRNAEVMGFIVTIVLLLWSGAGWLKTWFIQKKKNRIDSYYLEICEVMTALKNSATLHEIDELEHRLFEIRRSATNELVKEKLDADTSFSIYQNMLNGCQSVVIRKRKHFTNKNASLGGT